MLISVKDSSLSLYQTETLKVILDGFFNTDLDVELSKDEIVYKE